MDKKIFGCIGENLGHSFSEEIHKEIGNYSYKLIELTDSQVEDYFFKKEFFGINVTIPYKQRVMKYLDFIDPVAEKIGAVNTVVNKDGKLYGYNTDYFGMTEALKRMGISLLKKEVLILGTGGTSKTAQTVAKDSGAKRITVVSRTNKDGCITYDTAAKDCRNTEIIINTTPCGMFPNIYDTPIDIDDFPNLEGVFDAVYNPINTVLCQNAENRGIASCGGLYMLVAQAVMSSNLFFGQRSTTEIENIYKKILLSKENIVLIGMPSSGKTTVGEILSEKTELNFIDTDREIEKLEGMTPKEIFAKKGEEYFRKIENGIIKDIAKCTHSVIATGGGAVLDYKNVKALKQNSKVFFLDRAPNKLLPTDSRPTASSFEQIKKLYGERYEIYKKCADITVTADENADVVADKIMKLRG